MYLFHEDKESSQTHRKGKGESPSLFNPIPTSSDNKVRRNAKVCAEIPATAG